MEGGILDLDQSVDSENELGKSFEHEEEGFFFFKLFRYLYLNLTFTYPHTT